MISRNLFAWYCLAQGKTCSDKGELVIYVDNKYRSEVKLNLNWEGLIVEINGGSRYINLQDNNDVMTT